MAKGYIIARIDVTDAETYARYTARTPAAAASFGGRFLVRAGRCVQVEGEGRARNIVIEFPDFDTARAFYASDTYQEILPTALRASVRDLMIVEGVEED